MTTLFLSESSRRGLGQAAVAGGGRAGGLRGDDLASPGHTVGHALELSYALGVLPHGLAVCSWGMRSCAYVASELGLMDRSETTRHDALIQRLLPEGLPRPLPAVTDVMLRVMSDGKRGRALSRQTSARASCCRRSANRYKRRRCCRSSLPCSSPTGFELRVFPLNQAGSS